MTNTFNILPWTTTLKSLSSSPASLAATHWNRAVSETCARETISRRPLSATRIPSPWLTAFPSLYHLERKKGFTVNVCDHVCLFLSVAESSYVMTGAGVPVAWHSSSKGLLIITVVSVMSSAPSMKGGTRVEKVNRSFAVLYYVNLQYTHI